MNAPPSPVVLWLAIGLADYVICWILHLALILRGAVVRSLGDEVEAVGIDRRLAYPMTFAFTLAAGPLALAHTLFTLPSTLKAIRRGGLTAGPDEQRRDRK